MFIRLFSSSQSFWFSFSGSREREGERKSSKTLGGRNGDGGKSFPASSSVCGVVRRLDPVIGPQLVRPVGPSFDDIEQCLARTLERCQLSVAVQAVVGGKIVFLHT